MAQKTYAFIGKGTINLRVKGAAAPLLPIGNCSGLSFNVETNSISQPDYENAGGGEANVVDRISTVGMNLTMLELRPQNLGIALRASVRAIAAGAVTDERHTAYVGGLIPFNDIPDRTQAIAVVLDPDGSPSALVADTDYEVTRSGIRILEGGAASDSDEVGVDYTKKKGDVVEAMTSSGDEYELVFEGLNEAKSGAEVVVRIHKGKFTPTTGLELIGDDYAELPLEGSVLSDSSIVGSEISKYFRVDMAEPAS
ncbi:MAG: hypothetical protein CME59_02135 [Halioglobus sp.]|nr:hypothetical protein [Halioglobus sp.]